MSGFPEQSSLSSDCFELLGVNVLGTPFSTQCLWKFVTTCRHNDTKSFELWQNLESLRCFFEFKLHTLINHVGEMVDVHFTYGNEHDTQQLMPLSSSLFGYLFGNKGYIPTQKRTTLLEKIRFGWLRTSIQIWLLCSKDSTKYRCYQSVSW